MTEIIKYLLYYAEGNGLFTMTIIARTISAIRMLLAMLLLIVFREGFNAIFLDSYTNRCTLALMLFLLMGKRITHVLANFKTPELVL